MSAILATIVCCALILALFGLEGKCSPRPSPALWIPLFWFLLACSRPVSVWLNPQGESISISAAMMSEGSPVDRAVFTVLLVLGSLVLVSRLRKVGETLRQCWPLTLFLLFCLVSVTWSDFPDIAFRRWIREIGNLVMVLVLWTDPQPIAAVMRVIARTAYLLIPLSVVFNRYYALGRSYDTWTGARIYIGVTDNKNTLGMISVLLGVASVWRLLHLFTKAGHRTHHRKRLVTVHSIIVALAVLLLATANSVTAWLCAGLTTIVLWALLFRVFTKARSMIHVFVLGIIAIPVLVVFTAPSPDVFQAIGRTSTLTDRTVIWAWVVKLVPNDWVGAGYSSFWLGPRLDTMIVNVTHTWVPNQAHNGYLEVFANLGWVGVGLLGIVIFRGYFSIIAAWREKRFASDLMLAYFLVGVISNISEASFFRNLNAAWLFFLITITMPAMDSGRSPVQRMRRSSGRRANRRTDSGGFDDLGSADSAVSCEVFPEAWEKPALFAGPEGLYGRNPAAKSSGGVAMFQNPEQY